ncbi:MAG: hypothetical protein IJ937_08070, partial [Treponema sp.]|nr:hypothetical protein [Treponema sp.]
PTKLSGTVIGSKYSVDYANGNSQSTTVNTKDNVFDGDYATFFASYDRSRTWVGLDLGEKHIITKVGWSPYNNLDLLICTLIKKGYEFETINKM